MQQGNNSYYSNWKKFILGVFLSTFFILFSLPSSAQQIAFESAIGFGKFAKGGSGSNIYHVTTTKDSGAGSFRDVVSVAGRTVKFDIGGTINITSKLHVASNITIDGRSAPKGGITIYGNAVSLSNSSNIIVRYIRFRGSINMSRGACTVSIDNAHDVILDHVSISWGRWDNLHIKNSSDVTLQYCIIGEGIDPQRFGALLENPVNLTIDHCLWIDNQSRNPKAKAGIAFTNNIIYNWGSNGFVGGHSGADHYQDIIGNYFIAGPNSSDNFIGQFTATDHVYQSDNYVDMNKDGRLNGRLIKNADFKDLQATILQQAHNPGGIPSKLDKPKVALKKVLSEAGDSYHRDKIDISLINAVRSLGKDGTIIHTDAEVSKLL